MDEKLLGHTYRILEEAETATFDELRQIIKKEEEYILNSLIPYVTSPLLLQVLATDERLSIRMKTVRNDYISQELLEQMSITPDQDLLCEIARSNLASSQTLLHLSKDHNYVVRTEAVKNPKLPLSRVYEMLDDKHAQVAMSASISLKLRPDSDYFELPASYTNYGLKYYALSILTA